MALNPSQISQAPPAPAAVRPISGGACPDLDDLGQSHYPVGDTAHMAQLYSGLATKDPVWRRNASQIR